jgi:hypothetical protein
MRVAGFLFPQVPMSHVPGAHVPCAHVPCAMWQWDLGVGVDLRAAVWLWLVARKGNKQTREINKQGTREINKQGK